MYSPTTTEMNEELIRKIDNSVTRLKTFEPREGFYLAFSGGKDSCVCKALCNMAGVKYDAHYRVTGIDPPELVRFIKEFHPDVSREVPMDKNGKPITMWSLIEKKLMPPTRISRYCCKHLKETGGDGRFTITGVRWAESNSRKSNQGVVSVFDKSNSELTNDENFKKNGKGGIVLVNDNVDSRRMIEQCYKRSKTTLNPIVDWSDRDVWNFIRSFNVSYCSLYDEGFFRLGCIGCPMGTTKCRLKEFSRWPKFKNSYLMAFDKMLKERLRRGKTNFSWQTPEDVFHWWLQDGFISGQISLFDEPFEFEGED